MPQEDKTYFTFVKVIVGLLYRELVKVANNMEDKRLPIQIDFILDEFANCPPLSDIEASLKISYLEVLLSFLSYLSSVT